MTQYFSTAEAAALYDRYRPRVHHVILEWLTDALGPRQYARAVDVACGTGHSSLPLIETANEVVCLDGSPEMLKYAELAGFTTHLGGYGSLPTLGKFDLISTCMAFHWFDTGDAVDAYKRSSNEGAVWLIYNFGFLGHATNESFNSWLRTSYLRDYPSPPRNRYSGAISGTESNLRLCAEGKGVIALEFDAKALAGYFLTQSNIEDAVIKGQRYKDIAENLESQLSGFDLNGNFNYGYTYEIFRFAGT